MRARRGFSLPELLIVSFIFSLFLVASYLILSQGLAVWAKTESSQNTSFQLQKARDTLRRDLLSASRVELETSGSELWFLSSIGPQQQQVQHDDGRPFWQRNVLYFLAKPTEHNQIFKVDCGSDPNLCPHKALLRVVVDTGPTTTPDSTAIAEEVLFGLDVAKSLALPPTDLYPNAESRNVEQISVVATGLLSLRFEVDPKGLSPGEVEVTIKGFDLTKSGERVRLGVDDLNDSPLTEEVKFSVFLPD